MVQFWYKISVFIAVPWQLMPCNDSKYTSKKLIIPLFYLEIFLILSKNHVK